MSTQGGAWASQPWGFEMEFRLEFPDGLLAELEHERLDGVRQTIDFRSLAVYPQIVSDFLVALIHHNDRHFSISVNKSRGN